MSGIRSQRIIAARSAAHSGPLSAGGRAVSELDVSEVGVREPRPVSTAVGLPELPLGL